jgi:hypothetical protein
VLGLGLLEPRTGEGGNDVGRDGDWDGEGGDEAGSDGLVVDDLEGWAT